MFGPLLLIPVPRRLRSSLPRRPRPFLLFTLLVFSSSTILLLLLYTSFSPSFPATPSHGSPYDDIVIVSLASSIKRLQKTLPYTLRTLHAQSVRAREIRIYLPEEEENHILLLRKNGQLGREFNRPNVKIYFVPDQGPGTKFLPLLTEQLTLASSLGHGLNHLYQPLIILDDDHLYSPALIFTLLSAHFSSSPHSPFSPFPASPTNTNTNTNSTPSDHLDYTSPYHEQPYPNLSGAAFGLRGQRIRPNLRWANPYYANGRYTIHGWQIQQPYRVGYLTANAGYLILPSYFLPTSILPPTSRHPPELPYTNSAAILDYTGSPAPARLVDDIWLSAHLSLHSHPRIITPLPSPHSPSLALDQLTSSHLLSQHMESNNVTRQEANDRMIAWFRDAWEAEGLWFREDENPELDPNSSTENLDEEPEEEEADEDDMDFKSKRKYPPPGQGPGHHENDLDDPIWSSWWRRAVMNKIWACGLLWRSFVWGFEDY